MPDGISDFECVRRVHRGEVALFEILVRRYQKTIFNLAYRVLGDYEEAAEISQEVFLSAYRSIGKFRGAASFSTWLYRIALNQGSHPRRGFSSDWCFRGLSFSDGPGVRATAAWNGAGFPRSGQRGASRPR